MDNLKVNEREAADTAEAENGEKAAAALGKFKDVQTLLKAYSDLEAEFTRRCQRLKQLESGNKAEVRPDGDGDSSSPDEQFIKNALADERVKTAVIGEYLKSVSEAKGVPLLAGGGGVTAPRVTPKTVKQAGKLAREFLKD